MEYNYTGETQRVTLNGFLFDMDGTIIDSTKAIVKHWHSVGTEIGVDPNVILETSHGRRSVDVLKEYSPEKANYEYVTCMEAAIPKLYGSDAEEIPGARALLDAIRAAGAPWAIVTSGTRGLVSGWLEVLGLPTPEHLITSESVENGKPDPACYLQGLDRLGFGGRDNSTAAANVLVLEDSPAGIRAGKAAGCKVLGLVTSHTAEQVVSAGPDWVVRDLESVRLVAEEDGSGQGGRVMLEISNVLEFKALN